MTRACQVAAVTVFLGVSTFGLRLPAEQPVEQAGRKPLPVRLVQKPVAPLTPAALRGMPLAFEANRGQTDPRVRFLARGRGYSLFLTATEAVLVVASSEAPPDRAPTGRRARPHDQQLPGAALRTKFVGANPAVDVIGLYELEGRSHYFIGRDPRRWRTGVPTYARVAYRNLYPGVDLVYRQNELQLEYDFIVAPGADADAIVLEITGAEHVEVDARGDLVLHTATGRLVQPTPHIYQEVEGRRRPVSGGYVVDGHGRIRFALGAYDATRPLVIDPILAYSTYLGGSGGDEAFAMAVDRSGNVYLTGRTQSIDFPTANSFQPKKSFSYDAFVLKFNAAGTALLYSTFLGGVGSIDEGRAIAVDDSANAYVTGITSSGDFPTANAVQSVLGGVQDAFVAKLGAAGTLEFSTFLGGTGDEAGAGIAVDATASTYVTGFTNSANFPTWQPLQAARRGPNDAFVVKLDPTGNALRYSTFLGGTGEENFFNGFGLQFPGGISVDAGGNAYVTGATTSADFPTTNAFQPARGGGWDAFVAKLNPEGAALAYASYLGGPQDDAASGIAVDAGRNAYTTGLTFSSTFPTLNPAQAFGGFFDAFVTKIAPLGGALVYSTFLGGASQDTALAIAVDGVGRAHVAGRTASVNFPTVAAVQSAFGGGSFDAFVTKLDQSGSSLVYSTYVGGNFNDTATGVGVGASGDAYASGFTNSTTFPTALPLQGTSAGSLDAFLVKLTESVDLLISSFQNNNVLRYDGAAGAFVDLSATSGSGLRAPQGLALGSDDHLYVTTAPTSAAGGVLRYDASTGAFVDAFVPVGTAGLSAPVGLTFGPDSHLYVSQQTGFQLPTGTAGRVVRFDGRTGAFLGTFAQNGATFFPTGFVFGRDGHLYVGNSVGDNVLRFDGKTGALLGTFVAVGSGGLNEPQGLVFGPDGRLYVASATSGDVKRYDGATGAFVDTFVPRGRGGLDRPIGLAFGPDGNLYVSDNINNVVRRYDGRTGAYIDDFTKPPPPGAANGLAGPTFLTFAPRAAVAAQPTIAIDDVSTAEGDAGVTKAVFSVVLSATSTLAITVDFATADGTATAGSDYVAASGTLTFAPGETAKTITVLLNGDTLVEPDDTFFINLSNPTNATISDAQALGTIVNDDVADTTPPAPPSPADLSADSDSGASDSDNVTNVSVPIFVGTAEPDATVTLLAAGATLGSGVADAGGVWSIRSNALDDGTYSVAAVATDEAGNVSVESEPVIVTVDTQAPTLRDVPADFSVRATESNGVTVDYVAPSAADTVSDPVPVSCGPPSGNLFAIGTAMVTCTASDAAGNTARAAFTVVVIPPPAVVEVTEVIAVRDEPGLLPSTFLTITESISVADGPALLPAALVSIAERIIVADAPAVANTLPGTNVVVQPVNPSTGTSPVTLTFSSVTQGGLTSVTSAGAGPAAPDGFKLGDPPRYYDVTTSAAFDGPVTVCISYAGVSFDTEPLLKLFHFENGMWVDRTVSLDMNSDRICAQVTSLSPFAVFERVNRPPDARAGLDVMAECRASTGATVALDAGASSDPDGDPIAFRWTDEAGHVIASTAAAPVALALGTHTLVLTVTDAYGASATDTLVVIVQDTTPPALALSLTPALLWPPNHRLVPVQASNRVADACDPNPSIVLVSIDSNEPDDGMGDGDTAGDIQGASADTDDRAFLLRAERSGRGTGRVYTVTYRATDASGNATVTSATATVPHDRRR